MTKALIQMQMWPCHVQAWTEVCNKGKQIQHEIWALERRMLQPDLAAFHTSGYQQKTLSIVFLKPLMFRKLATLRMLGYHCSTWPPFHISCNYALCQNKHGSFYLKYQFTVRQGNLHLLLAMDELFPQASG